MFRQWVSFTATALQHGSLRAGCEEQAHKHGIIIIWSLAWYFSFQMLKFDSIGEMLEQITMLGSLELFDLGYC